MPKLGLYFDLRNPARWRQDPARLHAFTLEMCEEADRLGAASLWFTEHHQFDDDYLAQPLLFAGAAAARTARARVGTAILVAPIHHPVEIAEQAALVDLISNGRLDLGVGTGTRAREYELFGETMDKRFAKTDETVRRVRELWSPGGVTPLPVQERVPIWLGYNGAQGARRAGLLGESLLTLNPASWPVYQAALVEGGHDPASGRMSGGFGGWVSEDPDRDWEWVKTYAAEQRNSYARHLHEGTDRPAPAPVDVDALRAARSDGGAPDFPIDTPEGMAARIRAAIGDAPVDTVYLWASVSGMPEAAVAANVQTLCTRLAPLLAIQPGERSAERGTDGVVGTRVAAPQGPLGGAGPALA